MESSIKFQALLRAGLGLFEDRAELAPHFSRIADDLADHIAFDRNIVTGAIERDAHPPTPALSAHHPRKTDFARVSRRHDLTRPAETDAPTRGTGGVDHALNFTGARESLGFSDAQP